jgi:hypothetical protein
VQLVSEANLKKVSRNQRAMGATKVNVKLPRFSFEFGVELSDVLQQMGITEPFASTADFRAMIAPDARAEYVTHTHTHSTHIPSPSVRLTLANRSPQAVVHWQGAAQGLCRGQRGGH